MSPMSPPDEDVYCPMEVNDGYEIMAPTHSEFGESTGLRPKPVASFMCYTPATNPTSQGKEQTTPVYTNIGGARTGSPSPTYGDSSRKGSPSPTYGDKDSSRKGSPSPTYGDKDSPRKEKSSNLYVNDGDFMELNFGRDNFRERANTDGKMFRPKIGKITRSNSGTQLVSNNGGRKRSNTFSATNGHARGHARLNELERRLYSPEKLLRAHSPPQSNGGVHLQHISECYDCQVCSQRPEPIPEVSLPTKSPTKVPCMLVSEPKDTPDTDTARTTPNPFSLAEYNPNFPDKRTSTLSLNVVPNDTKGSNLSLNTISKSASTSNSSLNVISKDTDVSLNPNYVSVDYSQASKGHRKNNRLHPVDPFEDLMDVDFRERAGSDSHVHMRRPARRDDDQDQRARSGSHGSSSSLAKIRSLFSRRKVV